MGTTPRRSPTQLLRSTTRSSMPAISSRSSTRCSAASARSGSRSARRPPLSGSPAPPSTKPRCFSREQAYPGLVPQRPGPRHAHKLSAEVVDVLEQALARDSNLSSAQLARLAAERFGPRVHRRSVERALGRRKKGLQVPSTNAVLPPPSWRRHTRCCGPRRPELAHPPRRAVWSSSWPAGAGPGCPHGHGLHHCLQ